MLKKYNSNPKILIELDKVMPFFENGERLPVSYRDHKLQWQYKEYREFHLFPDVLIIYKKNKEGKIVVFSYIGSHSTLFR